MDGSRKRFHILLFERRNNEKIQTAMPPEIKKNHVDTGVNCIRFIM